MTGRPSQRRAAAAYKALIDGFVEQAREYGHASHVQTKQIFSKAPAHRRFNTFVRTLSSEQRALLAEMLREERRGAIHDLLAQMSWWIQCKGLALTLDKTPMPQDLSGMGMHGDFVGRMDDWQWPNDQA
jgi:hypothetical protein